MYSVFDCLFPEAKELGKNPVCYIIFFKKHTQLTALQGYTHCGAFPTDLVIIIIIIIMVIRLQWGAGSTVLITVANVLARQIAQNIYKPPAVVDGNTIPFAFYRCRCREERASIKTTTTRTIDYAREGKTGDSGE